MKCPNHPDQSILARGLCGTCYRRNWRKNPENKRRELEADRSRQYPPCPNHPSRPARRVGLCGACYHKKLTQTNPEFHMRHIKSTRSWRELMRGSESRSESIRRTNLRRYGITLEQYFELFNKQNGVCAICSRPESEILRGKIRALNVDHDHSTGKIRGLLCSECNKGIGNLGDSTEVLRRAIEYLSQK
jgi:hypothetical protein